MLGRTKTIDYYELGEKFKLEVTPADIGTAVCGNRRQCVIAHALDRQFQLNGKGYIVVDGAGAALTYQQKRYHCRLPKRALVLLRQFDKLGELYGQEIAREMMPPARFSVQLCEVNEIAPPASQERKNQINAARNKRYAAAKERGETPSKPVLRYVGI